MRSSERHPLTQRETTYYHSWEEWRTRWDEATHVETLHGLLHVGFDISVDSEAEACERIVLYLQTADGLLELDEFKSPDPARSGWYYALGGAPPRTSLGEWPDDALRAIARKAFTTLCRVLFADPERQKRGEFSTPGVTYTPHWERHVLQRPVLETLCWFFRLEDPLTSGRQSLRNLRGYSGYASAVGKHYLETARNFAYDLAQYILERRDDWRESNRELLDEFKPQAVDILCGLGKLDLLLHCRGALDDRCLKRLEELVMEWDVFDGDKHHPVKSVEQACLTESQAAKILVLLRVMNREQKKLTRIRSLQQKRADADHELQKLTS